MKPYTKPTITAFSLSGNEVLCGSCIQKISNDPDILHMLELIGINDMLDGKEGYSAADFDGLFGVGEGCTYVLTDYCKLTMANEGSDKILVWS